MESQSILKTHILELYLSVLKSKEDIKLYDALINHLTSSPNTREIILDALMRDATVQLACVIKEDKGSINLIKWRNILSYDWKKAVPFVDKKDVLYLIQEIDDFYKNNANDIDTIITWRDQFYAHFDNGWYSNNTLKAKNEQTCLSEYTLINIINSLENLITNIIKVLQIDVQTINYESDIESFKRVIKAGERDYE